MILRTHDTSADQTNADHSKENDPSLGTKPGQTQDGAAIMILRAHDTSADQTNAGDS